MKNNVNEARAPRRVWNCPVSRFFCKNLGIYEDAI